MMLGDKKGWRVMIGIVVLVAVISIGIQLNHKEHKRVPKPVETTKVEQVETPQPTPEELAERERLAEEKRAAELEQRRQKEEEYAAREAELAAQRIPVDEFNSSFLSILGLANMSEPISQTKNGVNETVIYPLDYDGELTLTEISSFGTLKTAFVSVDKINAKNLSAAWIMYCAAVQVYATPDEVDYIFTQLRLPPDGTIFDDIKNSRSVEVNGYIYKKNAGSKSVSFLITAKN